MGEKEKDTTYEESSLKGGEMNGLILPFNVKEKRYQLIELVLTNGKRVLAVTSPFIDEKETKQVMVKKFLVHPPQIIPRGAKQFFEPLFDIFKSIAPFSKSGA